MAERAASDSAVLEFSNLTLGYERHPAVHHLTTRIGQGDLLAIVGPNGAGKSTLLKGIMGQLEPLEGSVSLKGISRRQIAYLPQQNQVDRSFPISVQELVSLGAWGETGGFGRLRSHHKKSVARALEQVSLSGFEKRQIGSLSGGQMQRVLFARLLLQDAPLMLLDEPFTAVDSQTTRDLLALIARWHQDGKTIAAVLHDLDQVREHFPTTLLLSREMIAHGDSRAVLTPDNLQQARRLDEAFDEHARFCHSAGAEGARP